VFQNLAIDEVVERRLEHFAQAHDYLDADHRARAAFESVHQAAPDVSTALELGLAPPGGLAQAADAATDGGLQLAITFPKPPVRLQHVHAAASLSRAHSKQVRHCRTTEQAARVFSPATLWRGSQSLK
jgi:hypothetical protein